MAKLVFSEPAQWERVLARCTAARTTLLFDQPEKHFSVRIYYHTLVNGAFMVLELLLWHLYWSAEFGALKLRTGELLQVF